MSRPFISPEFAGLDNKLAEFNQFLSAARDIGEVCMVIVERQGALAWDVGGSIRVDMPIIHPTRFIEGEFPLRYFVQGRRKLTALDMPGRIYSGVDTQQGICVVKTSSGMVNTFRNFVDEVTERRPDQFTPKI